MTRARRTLLLTCSARRTRYGSDEATGRSPFLTAIDQGLLGRSAPRRARRTTDRPLRLL
jgi:superfamily I DNA/RNA helicase